MTYEVIFSREAEEDLERLFDHVLARELNSPTGDLDIPGRAIQAIRQACQLLTLSPFSCRKVGESAFVRELIISFRRYWLCCDVRNKRLTNGLHRCYPAST